jgi:uncharacterized RDD family membrane protein YckC
MQQEVLDYEDEQPTEDHGVYPVQQNTRIANYFIDLILFYIVYLCLVVFLFALEVEFIQNIADNPILDRITTMISYAIFMMIQELIFGGRSVGKFITKTKVVDEDGYTPSTGTLITRNLCRAIPFNAISHLFGRGWHDSLSKTYVVRK